MPPVKPEQPAPVDTSRSAGPAASPPLAHRNLPLLLLLAREGVIGLFRPLLKAHGLTEQQWRILRVLVEFGALEPQQIGRMCGLSSPSLAGILARMEEQGLVAREALAHDRRRQAVRPTPRSLALTAQLAPEIEATYRGLEERLGASAVRDVYRVLDSLIAALPVDGRSEGPADLQRG